MGKAITPPESSTSPIVVPATPTTAVNETASERLGEMFARAKAAEQEKLLNEELARAQSIANAD